MSTNKLIERSFKLELDENRKQCTVQVSGLDEGYCHWTILDLNAQVILEEEVVLKNQNSFTIYTGDIKPGQYILSISEKGQGTRHLKLMI